MSRPSTPTYKTLNGRADNKALKRHGSLAIHWPAADCLQSPYGWIDPDMV